MARRVNTVSMSVEEAKTKIARGESRSDFEAAGEPTDEEIKRQAADDPEERDWDWARASLDMPKPKVGIHIKLDADVVEFFKREGAGYQTRINAALKAFVTHARKQRA
jgi:uncharacterized protein (DUF4415 family)